MQVDPVEAEVDEALDLGAVLLGIGRDEHPALEILGPHELGHLLEIERASGYPALGNFMPPFGHSTMAFCERLLIGLGPRQVQLQR